MRAGKDIEFTVVVPTINSARWIGRLHEYYQAIDVDPLYCVDTRTEDHTAGVLEDCKARRAFVTGKHRRVESLLAELHLHVNSEWILRVDDDECPSAEAMAWIRETRCDFAADTVSFPRKWLHCASNGQVLYRATRDWDSEYSPRGEDRQFRLYRKDRVTYVDEIHTAGFVVTRALAAPPQACLYHFNWILRSKAERLARIAEYHTQRGGDSSWMNLFYIWEDVETWSSEGEVTEPNVVRLAHQIDAVARGPVS